MNTTTLSIPSYHPAKVAPVIKITDKKENSSVNSHPVTSEMKQFVMPPPLHAYLKGRDNDPL